MELIAENICKSIKRNMILDHINLQLSGGHIYGFVGINGAGKTMLFRALSGLIRIDSGQIRWNNQILHKNIEVLPSLGIVIENAGLYEDTPKTATSDRWVSLPTETMQLLRQYRAWQNAERLRLGEYYHDQGFLFAQEDGKPMHPDSITSWLAKFSKRHGLPHINPHAFRHTMASLLYFNGVDSVSISKRLGHAQVSTTCDIYSHVIAEADQRNADILGDIFLKKA